MGNVAALALAALLSAAAPAADGPAVLWSFDGTTAGSTAGDVAEAREGALRFATAAQLPGVEGQALALGVEPGDAKFLVAGMSTGLNPGASYTIEAWVYPTTTSEWHRLLLAWVAPESYHFALHNGQVSLYHAQAGGVHAFAEGGYVPRGAWSHIAGVAERNDAQPEKSELRVYLNGRRVARTSFNGTVNAGRDERVGIGDDCNGSAPGLRYHGYLDDLAVWHRALSEAEIKAHYERRAPVLLALAREKQRGLARRLAAAGVEEVIFAERNPGRDPQGHYYANFGYACVDDSEWLHGADSARLCRLNARTGELRALVDDPGGGVRDPCVSYDASRILFSYRKGGTHNYNLYEIGADGRDLRQLTSGAWDDIEPCYLPDGGIAFCSSRCKRYVPCWFAPVALMFRCNGDGSGLRMLSSGAAPENCPAVLPDGRILYTRWEYVNRDAVSFHHLWTMNPDGSEQRVFYGNQVPGEVFIDARPIPGTRQVVFVDSGYHGSLEHAGQVMVVAEAGGPNDEAGRRLISPPGQGGLREPCPVSPGTFLVAYDNTLQLLDPAGGLTEVYEGPQMVHEPRLLQPREREGVISPRADLSTGSATLFVSDIYRGRNMSGVRRGSIRKLLVLEELPKPANYHGGGSTPVGHGGTWTLKRILGTVPVEADGSAFLEAPPMRSLYFALLDQEDRSVKQMRSFVTLQPGESRGCVGCHESRSAAAPVARPLATHRAASPIQPLPGVPDVLDFPRDVQPILDRHCVSCHEPGRRAGGVELTGDRGPTYSLAFYNLVLHRQIADGAGYGWEGTHNVGGRPVGNDAPFTTYSSAAPLMGKIGGGHQGVQLSERERTVIRLWIDTAAQYAGTYAAYGTGQIGGWWRSNQPIREMDDGWPSTTPAADAVERRCAACHGRMLPRHVTDQVPVDGECDMEGWQRPTSRFSRHTVFNLTRPERSLILMAPLAAEAGGYAVGAPGEPKPITEDRAKPPAPITHPVIFSSRADPDYAKILTHIQAAGARLQEIKRFDMPGFRPTRQYLREMVRFGVLPGSFDPARDPADPYELDRRYWESLWHKPG